MLRQNWHLAGETRRHVDCTQKQLHVLANAASRVPFSCNPVPGATEATLFDRAVHGLIYVSLAQLSVDGAQCSSWLAALHRNVPSVRCHRRLHGLVLQQVCLREADLGSGDFSLSHLERCTVWLTGQLRALRMRELQGCTIVAAGVTGATFIEGAYYPDLLGWPCMLLL